jgi:hypothetical protein
MLVVLGMTAFAWSTSGQENDFGGWYSATINREVLKDVDVSVSPELRFFDNHSRLDSWILETDVAYKLNNFLKFGGLYRYSVDFTDPDANERKHRWGLYGKLSYRLKPIDISYRCLFQQEYSNYYSSPNGTVPENVWRNKVQIKYDRKKQDWAPYAYAEMFYTAFPEWKEGRQKLRLSTGIEYKINKEFDLSVGYLMNKEIGVANPMTTHVIAVNIAFDWK